MCPHQTVLHNAQRPLEYDMPTLICNSDVPNCLKSVCVHQNRSYNPVGEKGVGERNLLFRL